MQLAQPGCVPRISKAWITQSEKQNSYFDAGSKICCANSKGPSSNAGSRGHVHRRARCGNVVVLQIRMEGLANADQAISIPTRYVEKFQLLGLIRVWHNSAAGFVFGADEKPPTQAKVSR